MAKTQYGKWKIIKSLPEGGQAFTFIVKKEDYEQEYVLKRLKNIKRLDRFKNEIEIISKLNHPNVLQIIDADYDAEKPYFVSIYYVNGSLENLNLKELSNVEKLKLVLQICTGLKFLHDNGIIHRDLKPSNIYLDDKNNPVIGDFGLSYSESSETRFTQTKEAVGPRLFMAPEIEDGRLEKLKPNLDIYSLGKLIYWFFTGQVFSREKHRMPDFDLTQKYNNPEYYEINSILDKMIVENPDDRYQKIDEVISEINGLIHTLEVDAHIIDYNAPQPCIYCGKGNYKMIVKSP